MKLISTTIKVRLTTTQPIYANLYKMGHRMVLHEHNLNFKSNNNNWQFDDTNYTVMAHDPLQIIPVSGVRIEKSYPIKETPHIKTLRSKKWNSITHLHPSKTTKCHTEICALWNRKHAYINGISLLIPTLAMPIATRHQDSQFTVIFNAKYTFIIPISLLFTINRRSEIEYPNKYHKAYIWHFKNYKRSTYQKLFHYTRYTELLNEHILAHIQYEI